MVLYKSKHALHLLSFWKFICDVVLLFHNYFQEIFYLELRCTKRVFSTRTMLLYAFICKIQALLHACIACSLKPAVDWIAASDLEDDSANSVTASHSFSSNLHTYLLLTLAVMFLADTRSSCHCMEDVEGTLYTSLLLFHPYYCC